MRVVGDIICNRGDLRFHRGKAPELEVETSDVLGNADGNALLAIRPDRHAVGFGQRAVVLDDSLQRFPGQVEPVEFGIAVLKRGDETQRLRFVVNTTVIYETGLHRPLADMAEGAR